MSGTTHQIYHPTVGGLSVGSRVILETEESRHLLKALRARPGEAVRLFDGKGRFADAVLREGGRRDALVEVCALGQAPAGSPRWLGLGLLKGKAMDEAVRTATVLGVTHLMLLETRQGDVRFGNGSRAGAKLEGLQRTAIEACKQSGRLRVPEFLGVGSIDRWMDDMPAAGARLVASLEADAVPLARELCGFPPEEPLTVAIGPAGDFAAEEYKQLREAGFRPVSLGSVVLKAEMAVAYSFSVIDAIPGQTVRQSG